VEVAQVLGIGIVATVLAVVLRAHKPEMALLVSLAAGTLLLLLVLDKVAVLVKFLSGLAQRAGLDSIYFVTVLKVIAVAYLVGFGAQICRDAGERALGDKLELAGKIIILVFALPVMMRVLETVTRLLQ
jgi:stage III sporulation protein AD